MRRVLAGPWAGSAIVAAGLLVAACSSSGGSGGSGGATSAASGTQASVVVEARSSSLGTVLTDASGRTLYMFASDTPTRSSCTGSCTSFWPPLTTIGSATAGTGVTAGKLGSISGTGAGEQVTYAGHPLYYFAEDAKPGDTNGQGSLGFGARWWVLAPSGRPITAMPGSTAPSATSSTSSTSGGGRYP